MGDSKTAFHPGDQISFFELVQQIGTGGFGSVWVCKSTDDDLFYAIKIEKVSSPRQTLKFETTVLKKLQSSDFFPKLKFDGTDAGYHFLVMELLGPNLDTVSSNLPSGHFTAPFIHSIALQMLLAIEVFHSKGYVHRDIKPQNFVCRLESGSPICLLDYGISKLYLDSNGQHIQAREHTSALGSVLYSSPNSHQHEELSRRDDLYSFIYSLCHLYGIELPWASSTLPNEILRLKKEHTLTELGSQISPELGEIGQMISSLDYSSTPNYAAMKAKLQSENKQMEWVTAPGNKKFAGKFPNDPTGFLTNLSQYVLAKSSNRKKECSVI